MEVTKRMEKTTPIPSETEKVLNELKRLNMTYKLLLFKPGQTKTSVGAAKAIGCQLSQICKSIAMITDQGTPFIVLTAGHNRVDLKKISELLGENARLMKPHEVKQITGFEVGGVPPVAHATPMNMYMDESLLQHEKIYAAGGTANSIVELVPQELQKATNATIISLP